VTGLIKEMVKVAANVSKKHRDVARSWRRSRGNKTKGKRGWWSL